MIRSLRTSALCVGLLTGTAVAEDWPQFRGPTGQGLSRETSVPAQWTATRNVRWKVPVEGEGWSSPIVSQGRVYLTTAVERPGGHALDRSLRALCLDAETGGTVWNVEVFRQDGPDVQRPHQKNSHASPTPLTDGRHLYVHFGPQGTACLTLDGKIVWKQVLGYNPVHGNGGSPALVEGAVIVICDGGEDPFVVALEQTTGKSRWKRPRPNDDSSKTFSFSTPLIIEVDGQTQVVCPGSELVIAYDPRDGRELWQMEYDGYSVIPRPVFGHGLVFLTTGYNTPALLAVRPGHPGGRPAEIEWRMDRGAPHTPSPLLVGNELYLASDRGIASCLDARSGKVHWQKRLGGNYSASPVFAAGRVMFQSEEGVTTVIEAGTVYRETARNDLAERTLASPAIADSALFLRTQGHLYRIEER